MKSILQTVVFPFLSISLEHHILVRMLLEGEKSEFSVSWRKKGKQPLFYTAIHSSDSSRTSETESGEGRQFAMMAAQGLDVLWIRSSLSLSFFVIAASGAISGK